MPIIIAAFEVATEPRGFAVCSWPATSQSQAMQIAQRLSLLHANDPVYPNAFWVQTESQRKHPAPGLYGHTRFLAKFYRGRQYAPNHSL